MASKIITDRQEELGKWLCDRTGATHIPGQGWYIGNELNDRLVGVVGFDNYTGGSIAMHVAGEGKRWLTRNFLWFVFYYPFEQLKVNKIIGLVDSKNETARDFDLKLGFVQEACIKGAGRDGDLLILTMDKEQCKFLTIGRP